jgi:SnoaL-like protein
MLGVADRLEILDLYARYNVYADARDPTWVECFTDDGVFDSTAHAGGARLTGHDEIRAAVADRGTGPLVGRQHWNDNIVIDGDDDTARGSCYMLRIGREPETGAITFEEQGRYVDELRKVGGRWKFARRTVFFDMPGPTPSTGVPT